LFSALKEASEKFNEVTFSPNKLVSDAAKAIWNGFKSVFGEECSQNICYFHVKLNVDAKVNKIII
jgi:hypothetical protein